MRHRDPVCSCGLALRVFKMGPGMPVTRCEHCDTLCALPRDDCDRCKTLSRTDAHNVSFSPRGKIPRVNNNGEGMPPTRKPKAIEPPKDDESP